MDNGADLQRLLREEVGRLRVRESRRVFDLSVHVGELGGERDSFVVRAQDVPVIDAALRTDVVAALVAHTENHVRTAWVVRPGLPVPHDLDFAWLSAATAGFGIHGRPLQGFYAITRAGWLDVRSGAHRTWKRLRL